MQEKRKSYVIGIDAGTQGLRTGIIDSQGNIIAMHEKSYTTYFPEVGHAEQNPNDWWEALQITLGECLKDVSPEIKNNILACSICATSSTVLSVDREGTPLGKALLWMDSRAKKEAEAINRGQHEVLQYCGGEVSVEWMIPKVLWFKNNSPSIYEKTFKFVEQLDWLNYKLTGSWVSSICNTTCKWQYIEDRGGWNESYFQSIGLEDYKDKLVCEVLKLGDLVGIIHKDLAKKLGLPKPIPIVQGGIDAHIAMLGMGVVKPGKMALIMGTSFVHLVFSKLPVFQKGIWGPYNKAILPEYWLLEGGQITAGSITTWFKDAFKIQEKNPYQMLAEEASSIPVGSEDVIVLDFFQGNRTPYKDPDAKGVIYGLNLKHTRGHMYRAVLESIAYGTRNIIDNFQMLGNALDSLVVCGGVTKNKLWLQIIADITGKVIILNKNTEAGILGCGLVAGVGMKLFKDYEEAAADMIQEEERIYPNKKHYHTYSSIYDKYLALYHSLQPIMHSK
jgi:FGGY-family pentulose kinase